jgi:hypothetical protein
VEIKEKDWFKQWWWVGVTCLSLIVFFHFSSQKKNQEIQRLKGHLGELNLQARALEERKEELSLRLASVDDPQWIEMVLMKELGVVPEGYLKVYFKKDRQ